jgi:hypothetical protein
MIAEYLSLAGEGASTGGPFSGPSLYRSSPRETALQFGALVSAALAVKRFLYPSDTVAISRGEALLQSIVGKGNVTEADIKKFMRDGIRSALTAEMSKGNKGYVPIEVDNEWKQRGYGDFIGTATDVLVAFFESPTQRNYETVRGMVARQLNLVGDGDILASCASAGALMNAIDYVSLDLGNKLNKETTPSQSAIFAKIPSDQRLNVFSIPYARR